MNKTVRVRTGYTKCPYITAGKVYEATVLGDELRLNGVPLRLTDDNGNVIHPNSKKSAHLNWEGDFEILPDGPTIADELAEALEAMTEHYTSLINSGDAGFWDPETEKPVIKSREVLAKYRSTK